MLEQYENWRTDARELLDRWRLLSGAPLYAGAVHEHWSSVDGRERHFGMAWTDELFGQQRARQLHDFIRIACVDDSDVWQAQRDVLCDIYIRFFTAGGDQLLNAVTVTPSRIPRSLWPKARGTVMDETFDPAPNTSTYVEPITLEFLRHPVELPMEGLHWANRLEPESKYQRIASLMAKRKFNKRSLGCFQRLFQYNPYTDSDAVLAGRLPGMENTLVGSGDTMRVHSPMIQLWKIYERGTLDLLNIETCRASGQIQGIRATSQRFSDLLAQDPYFAEIFLALDGKAKRRRIG